MWHRGRKERKLDALIVLAAGLEEKVNQLVNQRAYRPADTDPGLPDPRLLAALAAPSRDGDLLHLEVQEHRFLAALGPGGDPEAIWGHAAALVLADGAPGVSCDDVSRVAFPASRVFPAGLRAVATPDADGALQVWLNAAMPSGEQRATLRKIRSAVRSDRRTGNAAVVIGALAVAGTIVTVASMHVGTARPHPANMAPAAPPVAASAPDWRRVRRPDYDGRRAGRHRLRGEVVGTGRLLRTNPAPSPSSSASAPQGSPAPSPAITVMLGKVPLVRVRHGCALVMLVEVCPKLR